MAEEGGGGGKGERGLCAKKKTKKIRLNAGQEGWGRGEGRAGNAHKAT